METYISSSSSDDESPSFENDIPKKNNYLRNFIKPRTKENEELSLQRIGDDCQSSRSEEEEETISKKLTRNVGFIPHSSKRKHEDFFPTKSEDEDEESQLTFSSKIRKCDLFVKPIKTKEYIPNLQTNKMMANMGYKEGHGLGKNQQGRLEPVEASKQRGRRGLGLHVKEFEPENLEWDFDNEVINVEETVNWLESPDEPFQDDLSNWCIKGPKKLTIDNEYRYCDKECLDAVLSCKSVFDSLEPEEMRKARTRSNPFETIRGGMFLNRAAMKMANLDKVTNFMFTRPLNENEKSLIEPDEPLYFSDVCAGPGGFSEYVLWRKKGESKGFGFTLKGDNDFRLSDFYAGTPETFEPHYGEGGINGDGNIFYDKNIKAFHEFVMKQTNNKGVHFMMADGGFSVDGQENIQEILSKQLYLCQCVVALLIVRPGGHFVCKLFDLFTPFSISLIYLMFRCFNKISIHKPNTSRPANSERYLICKNKKYNTEAITNYLLYINNILDKFGSTSKQDVHSIVPLNIFENDKEFIMYIKESNAKIAELQVINLKKIAAFSKDTTLVENRQSQLRENCLKYWEVPDVLRKAPVRCNPELRINQLLKYKSNDMFKSMQETFIPNDFNTLGNHVKSMYDWHCVVVGKKNNETNKSNCTFFLSMGSGNVYRYDKEYKKWMKCEKSLEIASDTLFYGELTTELSGEGKSQMKMIVLHIIDAYFLAGNDIRNKHLTQRHRMCEIFSKAHYKSTKSDLTTLKVKQLYDLENLMNIPKRFDFRRMKSHSMGITLVYCPSNEDKYFLPGGLMFLKATKEPWSRFLSNTHKLKYYYHPQNKESIFEIHRPSETIADFENTFSSKLLWNFDFDHTTSIKEAIDQSFKAIYSKVNKKR